MIDTHAHLNFEAFQDDFSDVIKRSQAGGMRAVINVGAQFETSEKAVLIAQKHDLCFASVGVHPIHAQDTKALSSGQIKQRLKDLAQKAKVIAIGETGLDYYHLKTQGRKAEIAGQKRLFKIHLDLALRLKKPVILHCRDAYPETLNILQETIEKSRKRTIEGVLHCFCGSLETAQKFLDLGLHLGFTGLVTYPGNAYLREVIAGVPRDKLLVETDCPYLPPQAKRGERNEPLYVRYVLDYVAKVLGISFSDAEKQTDQNALRLFCLNK